MKKYLLPLFAMVLVAVSFSSCKPDEEIYNPKCRISKIWYRSEVGNPNETFLYDSKGNLEEIVVDSLYSFKFSYNKDKTVSQIVHVGKNYTENIAFEWTDRLVDKMTYTIDGDPTEYEAWSEPREVLTYSLFNFTNVLAEDTWAEARYAVAGSYTSEEIQYSTDRVNWMPVPSGGVDVRDGVTIIDLTPETTYYLRGRCKSAAGWCAYDETSFTTEADSGHYADEVDITSIDYITETTATFTVTIS